MEKLLTNNDIKEYIENHIVSMGFKKIVGENNYKFGDFIPHTKIYYVMIRELDFLLNSFDVEVTEANTDIAGNIYSSSTLMNLYITDIIKGETNTQKINKTNEFLMNISNIYNIKMNLRKNKLRKINGRLGIEI